MIFARFNSTIQKHVTQSHVLCGITWLQIFLKIVKHLWVYANFLYYKTALFYKRQNNFIPNIIGSLRMKVMKAINNYVRAVLFNTVNTGKEC